MSVTLSLEPMEYLEIRESLDLRVRKLEESLRRCRTGASAAIVQGDLRYARRVVDVLEGQLGYEAMRKALLASSLEG